MLEPAVSETKETSSNSVAVERSTVDLSPKNGNGQSDRLLNIILDSVNGKFESMEKSNNTKFESMEKNFDTKFDFIIDKFDSVNDRFVAIEN
ncbi:MAG: hypothetical protein LBJ64_10630, partial [Deltaproteobacteria bacterium]|nr:hypothetical protein [Deltaproteobacteria bacterium]